MFRLPQFKKYPRLRKMLGVRLFHIVGIKTGSMFWEGKF